MHYLRPRQTRPHWAGFLVVAFLARTLFAAAGRELLVYYANETSPEGAEAANYRQFEQWLGALPTQKATNTLTYLRRDQEEFHAVVERETAALAHAPVPVLVFQNALARQGQFLEYRMVPGKTNAATLVPFPELTPAEDPVYRANPLAGPEGLDAALRAVRRVAERDGITRVGLIVKSHGSPQMALTPRLALWHTEVRPEELPALLEGNEPDPAKPLRGITREQFVEQLNTFQSQWGRPVEFLFAESCRVDAHDLRVRLNPGFRRLFAGIEQKMEYQTLDYPALLQAGGVGGVGFLTGFADGLKRDPRLMEFRLKPWPLRLLANWMYFIPLALVLIWSVARRLTSQNRTPTVRCASNVVHCLALLLMCAGCSVPDLSFSEHGGGVLAIGNRTCHIVCIAPDAKILHWWRWTPDFPELYVFEILRGVAMSSGMSEFHSLVIVNTSGRELEVLFDKPIYEATTRFDPELGEALTTDTRTPYRLTKDGSGKPVVIFGRKLEPISLERARSVDTKPSGQ